MRVYRFHSPLQHWFRGLLSELLTLTSFVASMFVIVWVVMWFR